MSAAKASTGKKRVAAVVLKAVTLSSIAARVLGRCRVMEGGSFLARRIGLEFPNLTDGELEAVIGELVDKELVTETGHGENAKYEITERGKGARVTVG